MRKTVVIVEDNSLLVKLYEAALGPMGLRVVHVARPDAVVSAVAQANPSLVIMDVQLQGGSGIDAVRQIREQAGMEGLPILAVTAQPSAFPALREAGVQQCLAKPIQVDRFKDLVRSMVA